MLHAFLLLACYMNCAEYRTTRGAQKGRNCLFKISCFTLRRRWFRMMMQRYKRTMENVFLGSSARRRNKCATREQHRIGGLNKRRRRRIMSHNRTCCKTRVETFPFFILCFHFEFSNATDNHNERDICRKTHTRRLNKKRHETRNKNEIKERLLNTFFVLNIFCL